MKLSHSQSNSKRASSTRAAASGSKVKRNQKMFTRASPMKLTRLYRHMSKDQKEIVEKADFSGLLQIKCSKLRPDLCKYLMESFDPTQCAMVFPGRGTIPVTEEYVQEVLCIPRGTEEVRYELDQEAISYMLAEFGIQGSKQPSMSNLEHILIKTKTADNRYLRLWVVYAVCSVLAPTTGINVSPRCYLSLMHLDPKKAKGLNFCRLVIQILCSTAKENGKNIFNACMLFMMVKYIDSLEFPELEVCQDGPRVSAWSNEMITKVIDADQSANGSFGKLQFKEQFQQRTEDMLFNNFANIESFVRQNTPEDCTSNELLRYKEAVKGACAELEILLQRFIRKASGIDGSRGSNKGVKRKSRQTRKARTTKKQRVDTLGTDQQHAGAVPVSSSADADAVSAFGTEEEHVALMTVPASPGEHNANNSDADYKCNSHEATVSSEDVTLDDEVSDNLDDQQQEVSEDSDFMQLPKQVRPQVTMKATFRKQSRGEDNSSKDLREETINGGFIEPDTTTGEIPIKRTTDTTHGLKIKDTHADNPCSAVNVPIHVARSNNILADLSKIYESDNESISEAEEGKDAEHPIMIT